MCGFLAVQTISEDTLANAVVADVVLRQHRVLMYALQLVVRVLSSLSKGARGGAGHVSHSIRARQGVTLMVWCRVSGCFTPIAMRCSSC